MFATLAPLLDHYGYLAVAALLFGENVGAPILPGETMLIAGAIYAGTGQLNVVVLSVVAVAASVAGGLVGWLIGRSGGRALALRYVPARRRGAAQHPSLTPRSRAGLSPGRRAAWSRAGIPRRTAADGRPAGSR